jgi:hypothetical protein
MDDVGTTQPPQVFAANADANWLSAQVILSCGLEKIPVIVLNPGQEFA